MSAPHRSTRARWLFMASSVCFALFVLNVVIGGPLHRPPPLNDVQEMLALFVSVGFFVFGTLAKEAEVRRDAAK